MIAPRVSSAFPDSSIQNRCSSPRFVPIGTSTTSALTSVRTRYTASCIEPPVRFVESLQARRYRTGRLGCLSLAQPTSRSTAPTPQLPETKVKGTGNVRKLTPGVQDQAGGAPLNACSGGGAGATVAGLRARRPDDGA